MRETTFYERLLGIERPWRMHDVRLALEQGDIEVGVEFVGETLVCPACGAACPRYDRRPRMWRHLDTMQYRTLVRAEVPRVRCSEHGVRQVPVALSDDEQTARLQRQSPLYDAANTEQPCPTCGGHALVLGNVVRAEQPRTDDGTLFRIIHVLPTMLVCEPCNLMLNDPRGNFMPPILVDSTP